MCKFCSNITDVITMPRAIKFPYDYFSSFQSGDLNNDSLINILDIVFVINIIFSNEYNANADINNDTVINVLDVVQLVNIILNN